MLPRVVLGCATLIASILSAACSSPPPGPDAIVFQWVQAFAAQDGTTVARLTCKASQADTQNARLLSMALGVSAPYTGGTGPGGQYVGGGGGQPSYDVSSLRYETTFADDRAARVKVTGFLRLASGLASQSLAMNSTVPLIREQEQWRVCDAT